jgi:hypothetical protein
MVSGVRPGQSRWILGGSGGGGVDDIGQRKGRGLGPGMGGSVGRKLGRAQVTGAGGDWEPRFLIVALLSICWFLFGFSETGSHSVAQAGPYF